MEVPSEVLQKLVCERCNSYLSRGPVHLLENTKYRCGRCPWTEGDEEEGIRVEAYEELAKLMSFPCIYQENGCTNKVLFMDNERHEQACSYREYLCPIAESGQCEWTGLQTEILEHCQQHHPTKVVENPSKFTYDITRPSLNNYILFVFEMLFLIQSKVCTATRKIYHAVRLINDPARVSDFKYTLDIQNNDKIFSTPGDVLSRELLVLQEDTSVVTGINSLLEMLGDFKDTIFTVTIAFSGQVTSRSVTLDHGAPTVNTLEVTVSCGECGTVTEALYRGNLNWLCREHAPAQRMCRYSTQGCTYSDISVKCEKHEWYYCQYRHWCSICRENQYYIQADGNITHSTGTGCTVSLTDGYERLIIDCDFGRAVCGYWLSDSYFVLWLYTPLSSVQLYKYRCTVELSHPATGHTLTRTPTVQYGWETDWTVHIPLADCNACVQGLMLCIFVISYMIVLCVYIYILNDNNVFVSVSIYIVFVKISFNTLLGFHNYDYKYNNILRKLM